MVDDECKQELARLRALFDNHRLFIYSVSTPFLIVGFIFELQALLLLAKTFAASLVYVGAIYLTQTLNKNFTLACWLLSVPLIVGAATQRTTGKLEGLLYGDILQNAYYLVLYFLFITVLFHFLEAVKRT